MNEYVSRRKYSTHIYIYIYICVTDLVLIYIYIYMFIYLFIYLCYTNRRPGADCAIMALQRRHNATLERHGAVGPETKDFQIPLVCYHTFFSWGYLRSLVPNTMKSMVLGTRDLKYWVLGPSGCRLIPYPFSCGTIFWA